jgi:NAD/NADP transhydrogenase alpha subunit
MLANIALTCVPIVVTAVTMTMLMSEAISAYSIAVVPFSSRAKRPTTDRAASG